VWGGATDRERVFREGAGRKTVRGSTLFGGTIEEDPSALSFLKRLMVRNPTIVLFAKIVVLR